MWLEDGGGVILEGWGRGHVLLVKEGGLKNTGKSRTHFFVT